MNLPLIPGSLPAGYCPSTLQELYNKFFALGYAQLATGTGLTLIVDAGPRSVADQGTVVWFNTTTGFIYRYFGGYWIARHPIDPLSNFRMIVAAGSESDVWAMDGGDGVDPSVTAPTTNTGAMWEVDHNFDFRLPVGVGTNPVTSNSITIGATGGEERVTLTTDEIPAHTHPTEKVTFWHAGRDGTALSPIGENPGDSSLADSAVGENVTTGASHQNMPPYRGVWLVKRTARVNYVA